jgi:GTP pyrophosphokinase
MSKVKNELEELSFRYLEPQAYEALRAKVDAKRRATEGLIERAEDDASREAAEAQVPVVEIDGRIKRSGASARSCKKQKIELEQVYDFIALRIITDSVKDCYAALGIIHQTWSPVPGDQGLHRDAAPNGYQSLHTSVISEHGQPFEGADPHA